MARITSTSDPAGHAGLKQGDIWHNPTTEEDQIWDGEKWGIPLDTDDDDELEEDSLDDDSEDLSFT